MPLCRGPKDQKCSFCHMGFYSRDAKLKHESEHECDICHMKANNIYQMRRHKLLHKGKLFKCKYCPMKFGASGNRLLHEQTHTKPLKCEICDWRCAKKISLFSHMQREHSGQPKKKTTKPRKTWQLECFICHATFSRRGTLRYHMCTHGEKKYQCDLCGKKFHHKTRLEDHMRYHTKSLKCNLCDFRCGSYYTRFAHIRTVHPEVMMMQNKANQPIVKLQYDGRLGVWA